VYFADRHPSTLADDRSVLGYGRDHCTPVSILAELQRIRIPWIRESLCVLRLVKMPEKGVGKAGAGDLLRSERSMRNLLVSLGVKKGDFRTVKEPKMNSLTAHPCGLQKPVGIRRCAVSSAPKREPVVKLHGFQTVRRKNMDIGSPAHLPVEAVPPVPIVVPRRDVDRNRSETFECRSEEFTRVCREPLVFVKVPAAKDRIDVLVLRELNDSKKCVS